MDWNNFRQEVKSHMLSIVVDQPHESVLSVMSASSGIGGSLHFCPPQYSPLSTPPPTSPPLIVAPGVCICSEQ